MTERKRAQRALAELTEKQRAQAMARYEFIRPHLENDAPLREVARAAGVSPRTIQRWLLKYSEAGLVGLARSVRADAGQPALNPDIIAFIEGMALQRPRRPIAAIHRQAQAIARQNNWAPPSYSSVYKIVKGMDPAMITLAQEGHAAYRDRFELVHRHRAAAPNAVWQADHTQLDILILDTNGKPARPWLTCVLDDYSRAIAGYSTFVGAPAALQTSLALRQAIWRKSNPGWPICGIPDILYVDNGSDFTSEHLSQVAADLRFQLVNSTVGRPQGRGKVERLFGTINTEFLSTLPGYISNGKPATPPRLSLSELDAALENYFTTNYNRRRHSGTNCSPNDAWLADGWLPRMPDSLDDLDLLMVMVAKSRMVRRDGVHFQGLRYMDPTLAAYVGESVTIRYDPRDIAEIRVFYQNHFLCRAICPDFSQRNVTLKDIQAARSAYRRALRQGINERVAKVADYLPAPAQSSASETDAAAPEKPKPKKRLITYQEDKE